MSYQVLARKWRPQVFEDVIGQEHITEVLINSLNTGRLHHGYLFTGIRGIGKTTTARILAKALNCVNGPTATPCNQCEFCKEITEGYSIDVEEIDGASNRGVDDVRILQENTGYAPSRSRYKVFIIDEVHMLTTQAFNALLKTLEEPPSNVVFIMATTEPWKIPMTILSRCQQFKFKSGTSDQLIELLKKLAGHEQISISDESLALLAKTAGGSVRDAENLFDQVIGFCGNTVQDEDVRYVLGIPHHQLLWDVLRAIFAHQTFRIFSLMEQLIGHGYNLRLFCMELMERIRNLMVLKVAKQPGAYLSLFDYTQYELEPYANHVSLSELQQVYWILDKVEQDMKFSPNPRYILEMALANMTKVQELSPVEELAAQLQDINVALEQYSEESIIEENEPAEQPESPDAEAAPRPAQPPKELAGLWKKVLNSVKRQRPPLAARIGNAIPQKLTQHEFVLGFHPDMEFSKSALDDAKNTAILVDALQEHLGRTVRVSTVIDASATSVAAIRKLHDDRIASMPKPNVKPQEIKASPPPEKRTGSQGGKGGKGNWQRQSSSKRYKPPVQVSVQDVVRMFDGTVEE